MNTTVHGRNVEINDWIREYVEKRVSKLERYLPTIGDVRADLTHRPTRAAEDRFTAQLTVWADGQILRAEESTGDIFASIDSVVDKLSSQIRRFKGRRYEKKRRKSAAAMAKVDLAALAVTDELIAEEEATIIRRKEFVLQPMDAEEAVEQMELLGHDFYLFLNPETQTTNVLYRRRDGHYGLLQPKHPRSR